MSNEIIVEQLEAIQSQLAMLQSDYKGILRTYYDMFYNPVPMSVTLRLYNDDGIVETITVPNRASDTSSYTKIYHGNPKGNLIGNLGEICLDTDANNLYYNVDSQGSEGWTEIRTMENFEAGRDYLRPDGDASHLTNFNAAEITKGIVSTRNGGTGLSDFASEGILKGVPAKYNVAGEIVEEAKFVAATPDVDYATTETFTGFIGYVGSPKPPAGFLVCDGKGYPISYVNSLGSIIRPYGALYDKLTLIDDGTGTMVRIECPFGEYEEYDEILDQVVRKFRVPDILNKFVRGWDPSSERVLGSNEDDAIPNLKGTWAQEITGVMDEFTGVISLARDEDGNPKMVSGATSAPGGSYDYLINWNAADYSSVYKDDVDEVKVKNIALLPVIKY